MIKKSQYLLCLLIFTSIIIFSACSEKSTKKENDIPLEGIDIKVKLSRFEIDLFNANSAEEVMALESKYPDFYPVYMYKIMVMAGITGHADVQDREAAENILSNFTKVPDFGGWLKSRADTIFPDLNDFEASLTDAMKRYHYYFPQDTIPEFITFLAPLMFNFPIIKESHKMGIGLDMYLGSDFKVYHSFQLADQFPNYRIRKMRKEFMLRDLVTAICENKMEGKITKNRVLDEMIFEGKILYILNALLPETSDSIKMGYTPKELNWAVENEPEIWAGMMDSKVLYSTKPEDIRDFTNDGPFTTAKGFGFGTAPRIGSFIGWQIIKSFMEKNPGLSLTNLINAVDADEIITKAKYKP